MDAEGDGAKNADSEVFTALTPVLARAALAVSRDVPAGRGLEFGRDLSARSLSGKDGMGRAHPGVN